MARKKVATGVWIPASAVRLNKDGSTSIIKPTGRQPNVAGYKVGRVFHPIRWDPDYDPDEVGEPGYATDSTAPGPHRGRGGRMIRGFFVGTKKKRAKVKRRKRR